MSNFPSLIQRMVAKFSTGEYTIKKVDGNDYDISTGVNVVNFGDQITVKALRAKRIRTKKYKNITSDTHFKLTVAQLDIAATDHPTFIPAIGDIVVGPDLESHRISEVADDQFGSAYKLYVSKQTWL